MGGASRQEQAGSRPPGCDARRRATWDKGPLPRTERVDKTDGQTRLKSLELQGYKTFASRVEFEFSSAITAIVGPNGSGKSNIADAMRWVLGEQSYALLRGKKTEDMIYRRIGVPRPRQHGRARRSPSTTARAGCPLTSAR